jgi:hypothetical protein
MAQPASGIRGALHARLTDESRRLLLSAEMGCVAQSTLLVDSAVRVCVLAVALKPRV